MRNKAPGKLNVSSTPRGVDMTNQMRNVLPPSAGLKPTHITGKIPVAPSGMFVVLYVSIKLVNEKA